MTRRRTPVRPDAGRDWRALAVDRVQRGLPLPVLVDGAPDDATHRAVSDAEPDDDVDLRLGRDDAGARVVLTAAVVYRDADELRGLARRLDAAADALDGVGS